MTTNQAEAKPKQDRFVLWVRQYGVSRLMRTLGKTSRTTIQDWCKELSKRHWPEVDTAAIVIWLSQREPLKEDGLPLTWDDIYRDLAQASVAHYLSDARPASLADVVAASLLRQRQESEQSVALAGAS